jgi:hypothetical protein
LFKGGFGLLFFIQLFTLALLETIKTMKQRITEYDIYGLTEMQEINCVEVEYNVEIIPNSKEGFRFSFSGEATISITQYKTEEAFAERGWMNHVNRVDEEYDVTLEIQDFDFKEAPGSELKDFDPVLYIEDFNNSPVVYLEFELR